MNVFLVYRYSEIALTALLLLSLKSGFWRESVFYALFHKSSNDANTKVQNKADYASWIADCASSKLILILWQLRFFFINELNKI